MLEDNEIANLKTSSTNNDFCATDVDPLASTENQTTSASKNMEDVSNDAIVPSVSKNVSTSGGDSLVDDSSMHEHETFSSLEIGQRRGVKAVESGQSATKNSTNVTDLTDASVIDQSMAQMSTLHVDKPSETVSNETVNDTNEPAEQRATENVASNLSLHENNTGNQSSDTLAIAGSSIECSTPSVRCKTEPLTPLVRAFHTDELDGFLEETDQQWDIYIDKYDEDLTMYVSRKIGFAKPYDSNADDLIKHENDPVSGDVPFAATVSEVSIICFSSNSMIRFNTFFPSI